MISLKSLIPKDLKQITKSSLSEIKIVPNSILQIGQVYRGKFSGGERNEIIEYKITEIYPKGLYFEFIRYTPDGITFHKHVASCDKEQFLDEIKSKRIKLVKDGKL